MTSERSHVRQEREPAGDGCVATLTLSRPQKRNALTPDMLADLLSALREQAEDDSVRALVLRGDGPAFCSGFDLERCHHDEHALATLLDTLSTFTRTLRAARQPIILAVHGAATAGGCAMLAASDIVVATRDAKIGYPVVRLGISPAVSASMLTPALAPGAARARLLNTDLVTGERAHALGLVHELCDDAPTCHARARALAHDLAMKPAHALRATKHWLTHVDATHDDARHHNALAASLSLVGGSEQRTLLAAALAPRAPQ